MQYEDYRDSEFFDTFFDLAGLVAGRYEVTEDFNRVVEYHIPGKIKIVSPFLVGEIVEVEPSAGGHYADIISSKGRFQFPVSAAEKLKYIGS